MIDSGRRRRQGCPGDVGRRANSYCACGAESFGSVSEYRSGCGGPGSPGNPMTATSPTPPGNLFPFSSRTPPGTGSASSAPPPDSPGRRIWVQSASDRPIVIKVISSMMSARNATMSSRPGSSDAVGNCNDNSSNSPIRAARRSAVARRQPWLITAHGLTACTDELPPKWPGSFRPPVVAMVALVRVSMNVR